MKNSIILLFAFMAFFLTKSHAQLKVKETCPPFVVDILDGKVSGVKPNFDPAMIKKTFPCSTSELPDSSACGSVLIYKDKDIKFYTARDYVEIGPNFKGKLSLPLMGGKRGSFFRSLGNPALKDTGWDAFQTQYGCLILYYNSANKVRMIRFSTQGTQTINLCE